MIFQNLRRFMKRIVVLCLVFIFVIDFVSIVHSQGSNRSESLDTSNIKEVIKAKMLVLEELIEYEILISEFYHGDYHITLKKAV